MGGTTGRIPSITDIAQHSLSGHVIAGWQCLGRTNQDARSSKLSHPLRLLKLSARLVSSHRFAPRTRQSLKVRPSLVLQKYPVLRVSDRRRVEQAGPPCAAAALARLPARERRPDLAAAAATKPANRAGSAGRRTRPLTG